MTTSPDRWTQATAAAGVALATAAAFFPAFSAGWQRYWDDDINFLTNEAYRGLDGETVRWAFTNFHHGPWQPLSWLSLSVDHALWGMDARGYHATNVLLHAGAAVVVFFLVRALLARARPAAGPRALTLGGAVGALFFAVHPLRVESVVWITERRDVLSGVLFATAALFYVRSTAEEERAPHRTGAYWLALLACALSLLAKGTGMMLAIALLVLDVYPLRRIQGRADRRALSAALADKIPFALLGIGAGVQAWRGQEAAGTFTGHGDALDRVTQALYGLVFYPWKTLVPTGLSPFYELRDLDPGAPLFVLTSVAAIAVTAALVRWRREVPALAAAWAAFAVLALPVLGLTQAGLQLAADRYSYLPCLAFAPLAGYVAARYRRMRPVAAAALLLLGFLTVRYAVVWQSPRSLWSHTVRAHPANAEARIPYALVLMDEGRHPEAETQLRGCVALTPKDAEAWAILGNVRALQDDFDDAKACWERAVELDPTYVAARMNLEELARRRGE